MATLTVRLDGTGTHTTIKAAVEAAVAGDTVQITQAGVYVEAGITVPANTITVKATVPGVDARIVSVASGSTLIVGATRTGVTWENFTLEAAAGSRLFSAGPSLTLRKMVVRLTDSQVGVYWSAVSLGVSLVDRCTFSMGRSDVAPQYFISVDGAIGTGAMTLDVRASVFSTGSLTLTAGTAISFDPAAANGAGAVVSLDNVTVRAVWRGFAVSATGLVRLRNCVYADAPTGGVAVYDNGSSGWLKDHATYCCLEGATLTGYPASNIAADPKFVAEDRGDFRLTAASPCRNAGTDLSAIFTLDRDGNAFGLGRGALEGEASWDIGAYDSQLLGDYVTLRDLKEAKGDRWLTDTSDDAATSTLDAAVAGAAVRKAEGLVNGYLASRYATPLDLSALPQAAVQQVRHWVTCLAVYLLAVRRDRTDANVVEDHRHCLEELQAIRDGKLSLGGATPRSGALPLHNHTTDGTEPYFTVTRTARGGATIDKNEVGSLDLF